MGEDLSWTTLCTRADADLQRSLLKSILIAGLNARYNRNVIDTMQALQPLLKQALDDADQADGKTKPVRRKYPADVVQTGRRGFILELNRKLPAPFCAWDASTDRAFWYEVGWHAPGDIIPVQA